MTNKALPQRKSPRLQGYDYASDGAYFVTLCTYQRYMFFGQVVDGVMNLDDMGKIAERHLIDIPSYWSSVDIDHFVVMPNHIHMIVVINRYSITDTQLKNNLNTTDAQKRIPTNGGVGTPFSVSDDDMDNDKADTQSKNNLNTTDVQSKNNLNTTDVQKHVPTLGQIVGNYKGGVTRAVRQIDPDVRLWQARYHDHIIRSEKTLNILRQYTLSNPAQWSEDEFYKETYL